jgi:ethanolamine-phosphate cytidylyltransferase
VNEVIIGAPYAVTQDMITSLKIAVVTSGAVGCDDPKDAYALPKQLVPSSSFCFVLLLFLFVFFFFFFFFFSQGIWKETQSPNPLTSTDVVNRILANFSRYAERNAKKEAREVKSLQSPNKKTKTDQ